LIPYTRNKPSGDLCTGSKATEALESLGRKRKIETGHTSGQDMAGKARKIVYI